MINLLAKPSSFDYPCATRVLCMGVVRSRWASWSSKPVAGRVAGRGGFDSHPLSPIVSSVEVTRHVHHKIMNCARIRLNIINNDLDGSPLLYKGTYAYS